MKRINEFLTRFKKSIKPSSVFLEKEIKKIISNLLFLPVEDLNCQIIIKNQDLIIKTNDSALKNEIFLKKDFILNKLESQMKKRFIKNIYFR
jgi:hypothetical protein